MPTRQLSDKIEELLEHLWIRIEEEKQEAATSLIRDNEEFRQLRDMGLIEVEEQSIRFTAPGREQARECVRRHRLAERLLSDILAGTEEQIHAAGCKFEHGLHRGLEEKVCIMLGHPKTCPHGKRIPPGECCRRLEKEAGQIITTVADLQVGEEAVVAYLHSDDTSDLRKLMAIGSLPGVRVSLKQRFPGFLIQIGHSQFGIDEHMARQIYVRPSGPEGKRRRKGRG